MAFSTAECIDDPVELGNTTGDCDLRKRQVLGLKEFGRV
jgi:hypothetical protein